MRRPFFHPHNILIVAVSLLSHVPSSSWAAVSDEPLPDVAGVASVDCSLHGDVIAFRYEANKGVFVQAANLGGGSDDNNDRKLPIFDHHRGDSSIKTFLIPNNTTTTAPPNGHVELARQCWCTQFYNRPLEYCPSSFDTCMVMGHSGRVSCFELSESETLLRGLWPIMLFWYGILLFALLFSSKGATARRYLKRQLVTCGNANADQDVLGEEVATLLADDPVRIGHLRQTALWRRDIIRRLADHSSSSSSSLLRRLSQYLSRHTEMADEVLEFDRTPQHQSVKMKLKTRRYYLRDIGTADESSNSKEGSQEEQQEALQVDQVSNKDDAPEDMDKERPSSGGELGVPLVRTATSGTEGESSVDYSGHDGSDDGHVCAICLLELENDEIVGDIECGHTFHKDCLKDWLRRKNTCPLCQGNVTNPTTWEITVRR